MARIIVSANERRPGMYRAQLDDGAGLGDEKVGQGGNPRSAVGDLVLTYPAAFGIEVVQPGDEEDEKPVTKPKRRR
jgi:hypothetical protein